MTLNQVIGLTILYLKLAFSLTISIWERVYGNSIELPQYISIINKVIEDELIKYSIPVYSLDYIKNGSKDLTLTVSYDLFLELLFLRIRWETIKFASYEKRKNNVTEQKLIKDIETLEKSKMIQNPQLVMDKKAKLEILRQQKIKGEMIRARVHWLKEGEKPTKFFCNLENKNFVKKTMKKIKLSDGSFIVEQKGVLHHIGRFYSKLFKNRDGNLDFEELSKVMKNLKIPQVNCPDLGTPITVEELGMVLKKCKQ